MIKNYIVAEYSVTQNCFHVYDMNEMVKNNLENTLRQSHSDYLPIGFFETEIEAHDFTEKVREQLKNIIPIQKQG